MVDNEIVNVTLCMACLSVYYYVISMSVTLLLLDVKKKHLSRFFDDLVNFSDNEDEGDCM